MRKVNNYLGVVLILVWGLAPFYWMVITALRDIAEFPGSIIHGKGQ